MVTLIIGSQIRYAHTILYRGGYKLEKVGDFPVLMKNGQNYDDICSDCRFDFEIPFRIQYIGDPSKPKFNNVGRIFWVC